MSQLVKTKRQANFKDFKRFGAFKGLVEQKKVVFNSFVCKLGLFSHSCEKRLNLRTNSLNKLLFYVSNKLDTKDMRLGIFLMCTLISDISLICPNFICGGQSVNK
jgi:hypothetical protein